MKSADSVTRERLAPRADAELARRTIQGSMLPFLLLLLIAAATPYHTQHPVVLWTAGGLVFVLGVARALWGVLFSRVHPQNPKWWRRIALSGTYLNASVWGGFASITLALHSATVTTWFTLLVTTGLAAGASVSLAPYPALAWHYILIILAPTVVVALVEGSLGSYGLAAVVALYAFFLTLQSRNASTWFWRAVTEESAQHARTHELEERTAYLDTLIRESPLATVVLDPQQNIRMCNPAFERLFQYKQAEIKGRNLDELIQTEESAEETVRLSQQALEGINVQVTTRRRRKDGSLVDVELHGVPLVQDGKLIGLFALYEDITSRCEAEARAEEAHQKLQEQVAALNQITGEIKALADMGNFLQSCHTMGEACTVIGRCARGLFSGDPGALYLINPSKDALEIVATWGGNLAGEPAFHPEECWAIRMGQLHARTRQGAEPPCPHIPDEESAATLCIPLVAHGEAMGVLHLRATGVTGSSEAWLGSRQRVGVAFAEEVALALANLQLLEKLEAQSIRDPLTGLFNRRYMEESLEREVRRAQRKGAPVSALMVDLDHFKRFNDTFGHEAGDLLLRELAKLLRQQVRGEDIVCRYGGEEFTVILPDAPLEMARQRAQKLCADVSKLEVRSQGQLLGAITLSIGAACYPEHGLTPGDLLRAADRALYDAKADGRNRVVLATAAALPQQAHA